MSKKEQYIKLVISDNEYSIYLINQDKTTKLNKKNTLIMSKILKKYIYKQTNNNTYIFPNIAPIMISFEKEKNKIKRKKVNREKSKKIAKGVLFGLALTLLGTTIVKAQKNDIPPVDNNNIKTEKEYNFPSQTKEKSNNIEKKFNKENAEPDYYVPKETSIQENNIETNEFQYYSEKIGDKKALENASNYMETFEKYEKIYGVDAKLLCAIAAQESSGIHRNYSVNGFATGLMGIENIWSNGTILVFNFDKNEYETLTVDYSKIGELDYNVKIGAAIFQNYFYTTLNNKNSNNIDETEQLVFTLQKYNMGPGNMSKILKLGNNWIDNREMIKAGDNNYFEHVLTRLDNNTPIKVRLADGTYHTTNIVNKSLNTTLAKM